MMDVLVNIAVITLSEVPASQHTSYGDEWLCVWIILKEEVRFKNVCIRSHSNLSRFWW